MKFNNIFVIVIAGLFISFSMSSISHNEEIPPTEDLMQEHGILNRVLLIYEEVIKRIKYNHFSVKPLIEAIAIIEEFIENHHEKLEEDYIFPLFERHNKHVALVATLRTQHVKGREITQQLKKILQSERTLNKSEAKEVARLLKKFIRMYRPHEAREDSVIFPMVRSLISKERFDELGEIFEDFERKRFGDEGFSVILRRVETIEKDLNIYKLEQFN